MSKVCLETLVSKMSQREKEDYFLLTKDQFREEYGVVSAIYDRNRSAVMQRYDMTSGRLLIPIGGYRV
jgi:predicted transcriptional regulator